MVIGRTSFLLRAIALICLFSLQVHSKVLTSLQSWSNAGRQFIENKGQVVDQDGHSIPDVLFKAEINGADIYVTTKGLTYLFVRREKAGNAIDSMQYSYYRFDISLKGASIAKESVLKEFGSPECYNFYYPQNRRGITSVRMYDRIILKNVYPNIDWVIYNSGKGLKYDFVIHGGGNPKDIVFLYTSADDVKLNNLGNVSLESRFVSFSDDQPNAIERESHIPIHCNYKILNTTARTVDDFTFYETEIGFETSHFPKERDWLIDPLQLWWGTFFGGNDDSEGNEVTTDSTGNLFVLGTTNSVNLPTHPYGSAAYFQGAYGGNNNGGGMGDLFISKFTNNGQLLWSTYFGGSNIDKGVDIECDKYGSVFVLGQTYSVDFPLKDPGGGAYQDSTNGTGDWLPDFLIAKFSNSGHYLWGTYYGGDGWDYPKALCIDFNSNVYCGGYTGSSNFPLYNPGGGAFFQGAFGGGFGNTSEGAIIKFSNTGQRLFATFFTGNAGEEIWSCASDKLGNTYFCGKTASTNLFTLDPGFGAFFQGSSRNGFILKLNNSCQVVWATYIGGSFSFGTDLVCDQDNNLLMTSYTQTGFPTVDPGGGAFFIQNSFNSMLALSKFNSGSQMTWSTYFGTGGAIGADISVGACNEIYLTFPCGPGCPTVNPGSSAYYDDSYDNSLNTGYPDFFIAAFTSSSVQKWGTFFGGLGNDQSMNHTCDKFGNIFYTGSQGYDNYQNWAGVQDYISKCIVDPGNGTYFQDTILNTFPAGGFYCVIGKFVTPHPTFTYSKTGCKLNDTLHIIPDGFGPFTYLWSTGATTESITNVPAGPYSFTVTDVYFGCETKQSFFLGTPTVMASANSTVICNGNSINLSAHGAATYSWAPSFILTPQSGSPVSATPSLNTTFTVTGSTGLNCIDEDTISIIVKPLPIISIAGKDSICQGQTVALFASGANNYTWSPASNLSSANSESAAANPTQTTIYTITGEGINSCFGSSKFSLSVISYPLIEINGSFSVCPGQNGTLVATGAEYFTWYNSKGLIISSSPSNVVSPSVAEAYTVIGINLPSCKSSSSVAVNIFDTPTVAVFGPDSACANVEFQIFAKGNGNFNWTSMGSLSCYLCSEPMASLSQTSYFSVTITDVNNCQNRDSLQVREITYCDNELIIPNVFTPNGDAVNDQFFIRHSKNVTDFWMKIYDRWGSIVFETDKIETRWHATTYNGERVSDGVYFYIIYAKLLSGRVINKSGNITVLD